MKYPAKQYIDFIDKFTLSKVKFDCKLYAF